MIRTFLLLFILLGAIGPGQAAVCSPLVLTPHYADTYSLKTFAEFPRWRDLPGDALKGTVKSRPATGWPAGALLTKARRGNLWA